MRSPSRAATTSAGELGAAALRPDEPGFDRLLVDAVDVQRVRQVRIGTPVDVARLAAVDPDDPLRRLVLCAHQCERVVTAELLPPELGDPVRIRVLQCGVLRRFLAEPGEQRFDSLREPSHDGVREGDRALQASPAHELHRLVDRRVRRDLGVAELVRAEPQRSPDRWIELAHGTLAERPDRMVERADALHGSEGEALRQRAVARVEARRCAAEHAIGVRVVLEDAQHDLVRRLARRHRRPRRNSSYVMRRLPSGWTSSGSSLPPATRAFQIVTGRPCSSARAPMCGESARMRFSSSPGSSSQSSSRSAAVIFSAYVAPSSSCGVNSGWGRTSLSRLDRDARGLSRRRLPHRPARRSGTHAARRSGRRRAP